MILLSFILAFLQLSTSIPFTKDLQEQSVDERQFGKLQLQEVQLIKPDTLYRSGLVKSNGKYLGILDYQPNPRIIIYNTTQQAIISEIGNRPAGRGPGEIINPTDFAMNKDQTVWIADHPNSKLVKFNMQNELLEEQALTQIPYKIISMDNTVYMLSSMHPAIKKLDNSGKAVWESELLIENPLQWNSVVTGFILNDQNGNVYKIANYAGYIAKFNKKGKLQYSKEIIENNQSLTFTEIDGLDHLSLRVDTQKLQYAVADGFIKDGKMYLLTQFYGDNKYQVIDVYDTDNGDYLHSFKLDKSVRSITALPGKQFAGGMSSKVIVWKISGI